MELKVDQENFKHKVATALNNKRKANNLSYVIEDDLSDIQTSNPPRPAAEIIQTDLKRLQEEFDKYGFHLYVDVYKEKYAMVKTEYVFSKYTKNETGIQARKWCENFNYAHHALALLNDTA